MGYKIAFVVATKDRPADLRTMLTSVREGTVAPHQIVIVDASKPPVEEVTRDFPELNITYMHHWPPSAAAQRNAGLAAVHDDIDLIGFFDDDITLATDALEKMLEFWDRAPADQGGAGFNWMNGERRSLVWLKKTALTAALGLYSNEVGGVAPSGWQGVTGAVDVDTDVQWLPSGAVVWRRDIFQQCLFDEFFQGYSYLEDLDFSYSVSRKCKLSIVAGAQFCHYPASGGRISRYHFGKIEVANRLYFVRKHGLSVTRCCMGLAVRMLMTGVSGVARANRPQLTRGAGNLVGMASALRRYLFPGATTPDEGDRPAPTRFLRQSTSRAENI